MSERNPVVEQAVQAAAQAKTLTITLVEIGPGYNVEVGFQNIRNVLEVFAILEAARIKIESGIKEQHGAKSNIVLAKGG